jgi:hypothetical protein
VDINQINRGLVKEMSLGDMMLAPLKVDKRLVAILYADGAEHRLTPRQFEDFQLIANQLNLILKVNAATHEP